MARFKKRAWGWYLVLLNFRQFKVKLLRFKLGGQLSVQYHNHRSELWLFLTGVHKGNFWLINKGEVHTYYANGERPLVLEIQYGEKCNESDIVRIP
jgi:hypothetical protein